MKELTRAVADSKEELAYQVEELKRHVEKTFRTQSKAFDRALEEVGVYKEKDDRQDSKLDLLQLQVARMLQDLAGRESAFKETMAGQAETN